MKIEAIVCDMDGTLVSYPNKPFSSSWDALAEALLEEDRKEWFKIRDFYYSRRDLYPEWYKKQVNFLKGLRFDFVSTYLFPVPYSKGVKEFFLENSNRYKKGVITSGLKLVADKIAEELGFNFVKGNHLSMKKGVFTGEESIFVDLWDKSTDLLNMSKEYDFDLNKTIYVGDNENDISAFNLVGYPVAFKPKTLSTRDAADYVINDFRELDDILY